MKTVQQVFEILKEDDSFVYNIMAGIRAILKDGKIDHTDIPEMILIIVNITTTLSTHKLKVEDMSLLVKLLFQFIVEKYDLIKPQDKDVIYKLLESSLKLAIASLKVKNNFNCLNCIRV